MPGKGTPKNPGEKVEVLSQTGPIGAFFYATKHLTKRQLGGNLYKKVGKEWREPL